MTQKDACYAYEQVRCSRDAAQPQVVARRLLHVHRELLPEQIRISVVDVNGGTDHTADGVQLTALQGSLTLYLFVCHLLLQLTTRSLLHHLLHLSHTYRPALFTDVVMNKVPQKLSNHFIQMFSDSLCRTFLYCIKPQECMDLYTCAFYSQSH